MREWCGGNGKSNGWLDGQPAIITRKAGTGSITYIGACFDEKGVAKIAHWMQEQFNLITPLPGIPAGVEVSQRYGPNHAVTLLVNFSGATQDVLLPLPMKDILQGSTVRQVHLASYGVAVLDQPR
jgi:beta-galactosidase